MVKTFLIPVIDTGNREADAIRLNQMIEARLDLLELDYPGYVVLDTKLNFPRLGNTYLLWLVVYLRKSNSADIPREPDSRDERLPE